MALFSKNTLTQVSGFDNQIISGELVYNQKTFWNLALATDGVPIDLTRSEEHTSELQSH